MSARIRRRLISATVVPVLLVVALLTGCGSDGDDAPAHSFFADFTVVVEPQADHPLTRIGIETEGGGSFRWWYEERANAPDRWRWELETAGPPIDAETSITVFDGEYEWGHNQLTNSYRREPALELPPGFVRPLPISVLIGPANAEDIEAFMREWRERGSDVDVRLGGEETILGRVTRIVEIRRTGEAGAQSATATAPGSGGEALPPPEEPEPAGSLVRAFIDPERMFVMRWQADGGYRVPSVLAEVTALEYDTDIDEALLTFEPPPGAREDVDSPSAGCVGTEAASGRSISAQAGFFGLPLLPDGYRLTASGSEGSGGGCTSIATWALAEDGDGGGTGNGGAGGWLLLRQRIRADGIPPTLRSGEAVTVRSLNGYRAEEDGVVSLVWSDGELVAELSSNALPAAELLRLAESAQGPRSR